MIKHLVISIYTSMKKEITVRALKIKPWLLELLCI